jgi:hypothetical protein
MRQADRRRLRSPLLGLLLAGFILVVPAAAEANFVYWTNTGGTTIGRAKLNGSGANNSFIAGLNDPHGIAVDSRYIYWSQGDVATGTIGRANLDGSGSNPNFIPHSAGVNAPIGVAVTPAAIYWANGAGTVGRANLDGTAPAANFITAPGTLCGIAADSNFVYWLDVAGNRIGRATLSNSSSDPSFITGITGDCGVAVDSSFIYWGSNASSIGRAAIGGGGATDAFIPAASSADPCGVAVNPQYVFWGNPAALAVGRANLKGTGSNPAFVLGPTNPCGVAAAPSNKITFTGTKYDKKKGTAKISGKVSGPGQIQIADNSASASGKTPIKTVGLTLTAAGAFSLPVKPKGKTSKTLKKKGKAKVKSFVSFTPSGVAGVTNSQKRNVTLVKKKKKKG